MTDQADRLFDVTPYGGDETPSERRRRIAGGLDPTRPPVEPLAPGWTQLTGPRGVLPYFHLVSGWAGSGASAAVCGKVGPRLTNEGVTHMIRCPECDITLQLDHSA